MSVSGQDVGPPEEEEKGEKEKDAAADVSAELPARDMEYVTMWYKRDHSCAIRQRSGAQRQVLSFGGKNAKHKGHDELVAIGQAAIAKIKMGWSYWMAKTWAQKEAQNMDWGRNDISCFHLTVPMY